MCLQKLQIGRMAAIAAMAETFKGGLEEIPSIESHSHRSHRSNPSDLSPFGTPFLGISLELCPETEKNSLGK